jgi:hypothetical protein
VTKDNFAYELVLADDQGTITSIIAYKELPGVGLRGVLWSVPDQKWISAPAVVSDLLYDESDPVPTRSADRTTAERLAHEILRTELPSEQALTELYEEGERMGWRFGPPSER